MALRMFNILPKPLFEKLRALKETICTKKKPFPTEKLWGYISTEFNGFFLQSSSTLLANELFFLSLILLHLKLDLQ